MLQTEWKTIPFNLRTSQFQQNYIQLQFQNHRTQEESLPKYDPLSVDFDSIFATSLAEDCSPTDVPDGEGFLNCTKIMVMLSQPKPTAVDGARHLSSTFSQITESLFSWISSFTMSDTMTQIQVKNNFSLTKVA